MPADELKGILVAYKTVMEASWPNLHPAMKARAAQWPAASEDALQYELREYVLYPYLEAARLRRDLTANGAIATFLDQHRDEPVAGALRREWLGALGTRRDWTTYLAHYLPDAEDPSTLRCHALAARIALGREQDVEHDALEQWLVDDSAPEACDPVFAWLRSRGLLTPAVIEQRARLALAANHTTLARFLARDLPAGQAAPLLLWADLLDRPQPTVDRLLDTPGLKAEPDALLPAPGATAGAIGAVGLPRGLGAAEVAGSNLPTR